MTFKFIRVTCALFQNILHADAMINLNYYRLRECRAGSNSEQLLGQQRSVIPKFSWIFLMWKRLKMLIFPRNSILLTRVGGFSVLLISVNFLRRSASMLASSVICDSSFLRRRSCTCRCACIFS